MDPQRRPPLGAFTTGGKPYGTPVIFAPPSHPAYPGAPGIKRDASVIYREAQARTAVPLLEHYTMGNDRQRQDSLGLGLNASNYALAGRRESATMVYGAHVPGLPAGVGSGGPVGIDAHLCRFRKAWTVLSVLQMVFGVVMLFVSLYAHYPIFSCGWSLVTGEDRLWFGTWIGILNLLCGVCGSAASKSGLSFPAHKLFRRVYFILNCSFVPFANGIGLAAFGITMASYRVICNQLPNEHFTLVMAFLQLCLLTICMALNIIGVVYQVLATMKCKCWICHPRNQTHKGYVRTT